MEDHPLEIQTVWICKPNENGNPPEVIQKQGLSRYFQVSSGSGKLEKLRPLQEP